MLTDKVKTNRLQRDRQTERQTDRQTEGPGGTETDRQTDRQTGRYGGEVVGRQCHPPTTTPHYNPIPKQGWPP